MNKAIALENNTELKELILAKAAKKFYSRADNERFDLFPFYSILVSTGVNKNTDAFDPKELWKARHSPADKPVNIGHKQTKIIGHIIDNIVVGADLKPIPEDTPDDELPLTLHVVTAAVIYRVWEDPAVQAEVDALINKISKGQIFVSMECLFRNFDYLLTNASTNEQRILPRNQQTASLTKYLRQYKGPGKIHGYALARLLRDITFSAVGIVEKPANPDSIISASLDLFSASASEPVYINIDNFNISEKTMADVNIKESPEYKTIEASLASLQGDYDRLKKDNEVIHTTIAEYKVKVDDLNKALATSQQELEMAKATDNTSTEEAEATIANLKETVTKLEARITEIESSKAELTKANDAMDATIKEFKKASKHSDRAEAMMSADNSLSRQAALATVAKYDELSDASFAAMVDMLKGYASRAPQEVTAETVLATAQAEKDAPLGGVSENNLEKTSADIKNWLVNTKKGS